MKLFRLLLLFGGLLNVCSATLRAQEMPAAFGSEAYCTRLVHITELVLANTSGKEDPKYMKAVLSDHPSTKASNDGMYFLKYAGEEGMLMDMGILTNYAGTLPTRKFSWKEKISATDQEAYIIACGKDFVRKIQPCLQHAGFSVVRIADKGVLLVMSKDQKVFVVVTVKYTANANYEVLLDVRGEE